jgi:CubicO group peptidase (beta-lactamase class C family)
MNHRAGFPLGLGGDFDTSTRDQLIAAAMNFKLLFEPGSRESYSNTGFALLAAIIEKVSGKTYDEYVRDNILQPLGLTRTGFLLPRFEMRDLAHGYDRTGADAGTMLAKPHAADGPYWNLRGNGGMLSTARDMYNFYKALFTTEKLLRPATRNLRFDPNQPAGLAGSDLVNFFLYERDPRSQTEMIIASTNQNMKAPEVRRELAPIIGLPQLNGPGGGGGAGPIARAIGKPVPEGAASVIRDFIAAINKGDKAGLTAFISAHYVLPADQAPAEVRAERLSTMHENLGVLTILSMAVVEDGGVQVVVKSTNEGQALISLDMEQSAPWRIRRLGLQVGGG